MEKILPVLAPATPLYDPDAQINRENVLNLLKSQSVGGHWNAEETLAVMLGLPSVGTSDVFHDVVLRPEGMAVHSASVWATIVVLVYLHEFAMAEINIWNLAGKKAAKFLAKNLGWKQELSAKYAVGMPGDVVEAALKLRRTLDA